MFLFGHIGITLGAAVLGSGAYTILRDRFPKPPQASPGATPDRTHNGTKVSAFSPSTWIGRLDAFIDIRLLLIGSILPDIIDKPVGHFFFNNVFHNGRIFSHTLLFLLVLLVSGIWLYAWKKKTWLLTLAFGVLTHLILDQMWMSPRTFYWPLYGWRFPGYNDTNIIGAWLTSLIKYPADYIPEIFGVVIVGWVLSVLIKLRGLRQFLIGGR
jgi:inner membrane protein